MTLLSKEHSILEKGDMEGRPFGTDARGEQIREVSGLVVKANVEYLEETISRTRGKEAGAQAVEELARLLNGRIREREYHVTPAFLRNPWNSYSYEFVMFLGAFCQALSGDPQFAFHCGQDKFLPPLIQILGKPFSPAQVYRMFPWFGDKYAKGSLTFESVAVEGHRAILRMQLKPSIARQFGPYRQACAWLICQSAKAALAMIPVQVHGMRRPATIVDRVCMAEGDDWCEWEFQWKREVRPVLTWGTAGLLIGLLSFGYLLMRQAGIKTASALLGALLAAGVVWGTGLAVAMMRRARAREQLIQEEFTHVAAQHEELRETCAEQSRMLVEVKRHVARLSALHQTAVIFSSTLDREVLIERALDAIKEELHYDRVILMFYDLTRQVCHETRMVGVEPDLADEIRSVELRITDPTTIEGRVLLRGERLLVSNVHDVMDQLHPMTQRIATRLDTKALISLPVHRRGAIVAALTVERSQPQSLTQDDLDLMGTVASQLGVALDNAEAYRRIEELNVGLEERIRERTKELTQANTQLQAVDAQKDLFLMAVSHDLQSPLTAIKGFADNILAGIATTPEKQTYYLTRIRDKSDQLARMIKLLLNIAEIKSGRLGLCLNDVDVSVLAAEVVEQLQLMAQHKRQQLTLHCADTRILARADVDKLTQVLSNLIDNAMKYTPVGGTIEVLVRREAAGYVGITVVDTGEGMAADVLPKIFDPFYQVARRSGLGQKGVGLGLWIVKQLVDLQGGTLSVRSEVGKGTEFDVRLPLVQCDRLASC